MIERCAIFSALPKAGGNRLALKKEWSQDSPEPLHGGFSSVFVICVNSVPYLVGYDKKSGHGLLFPIEAKPLRLLAKSGVLNFKPNWEILEPFVIGNQPHILSYRAKTGQFAFFPVSSGPSLGNPYSFNRTHDPGITSGFTMVKPVVYQGAVYYMGYNEKSGTVALYSLVMTATSPNGSPPLLSANLWSHTWARGWTRFAFFQLGGENFFLKTNIWRPNVNIDHILDDFSKGTYEVCSHMDLKDAQSLDIVSPFSLVGGAPHFLAYKESGETILYRIHPDCMGWTEVASATVMPGATHIVPVRLNNIQLFLFYSNA